jgi:hypothetical protein
MPTDWTVRTAATCDIEGLEFKKCTRCDHEITQAIPKLTGDDCNGTNIQDLETENGLQIFPNPVIYELTITNYDFKQGDMVELFDMQGKRVFAERINSQFSILNSPFVIDMTPFQSGNYILRMGNRVAKVVKQ